MKKKKYKSYASSFDKTTHSFDNEGVEKDGKYQEHKKLSFLWSDCNPKDEPSVASAIWEKVQQKQEIIQKQSLSSISSHRNKRFFPLVIKYGAAASIVLAVLFSYLYFNGEQTERIEDMVAVYQDVSIEDIKEVTLVISNDQKLAINDNSKIVSSKTGQIAVDTKKIVAKDASSIKKINRYGQLIVPKGKRSQLKLADGTVVHLNSNSKIIFPRTFNKKTRTVYVEGEAYFDVVHNASKPFIVKTLHAKVRVLGTQFNLICSKKKSLEVVLVKGSVLVKTEKNRRMKMVPNEKLNLTQNGEMSKQVVDVNEYVSWKDDIWYLKGEQLQVLLTKLEDYYGKEIICDASIMEEPIYGKLYLNDNLSLVLDAILSTMKASTEKEKLILCVKP